MIPAPFEYVRASSIDEAVSALSQHGEDAKVLAGGHSLLPLMKLRLSYPSALIDIGRISELQGVRDDGDYLTIGAMTRHVDVVADPLVNEHCKVLAEATEMIGDPQVRHRGTIGGALAHGDAAGDLPAVALTLEAELVTQGPNGYRAVPASEFFRDYLETALAPDELLVGVRVPKLSGGWSGNYQKFSRVAQAWAIVGVCAVVNGSDGGVAEARIGLTNMGTVPVRASAAEQALASGSPIADAAAQADEGTDPPSDLNGQADYRRHLARVLTRRALEAATA